MLNPAHPSWREFAIRLYFTNYGDRCNLCLDSIRPEDALLDTAEDKIILIHANGCGDGHALAHLPEGSY